MTHDYPFLLPPVVATPRAAGLASAQAAPRTFAPSSAVRYPGVRRSRWPIAIAVIVSAALHASLLVGVRSHRAVVVRAEPERLIALTIPLPDLKDLEEPEPVPTDTAEKPDPGEYAPSLPDAPQIALPHDFIQEINFASLVPAPDLTAAKIFVIPQNINRSGHAGEGLVGIFSLADLDRVPEPIAQPSPTFPPLLKREVNYARIVVEFIVDVEGRVVNPIVVDASYAGFEDAALAGVSRWRFRPGMRAGRKVNTRMAVPIVFRVREENE